MTDTIKRLIISTRYRLNRFSEKFDGVPTLLKFLIALGLSTPLLVLGGVIETGLSFSIILLSAFLALLFIASSLMLLKNKHSRLLYVFANVLLGLSPFIAPSLKQFTANASGSSPYELTFFIFLNLAICLYLFLNKSVSNYFGSDSSN